MILLGNNLINAAAATLTAVIAERLFGEGELALAAGTLAITFLILVFSEITPKVIGAAYADRHRAVVALRAHAAAEAADHPVVWFVNIFVQGLLKLAAHQSRRGRGTEQLSQEELRSLVLEGSQYFRGKHRAMLANLFELEAITVDDVMMPRSQIHAHRPRGEADAAAPAARDVATTRGCRSTRTRSTTSSASCTLKQVVALAAERRDRRRAAARAAAPALLRAGRARRC